MNAGDQRPHWRCVPSKIGAVAALLLGSAGGTGWTPAWAGGIPTFDVAAQAQLKLQLEQLREQYKALQGQLSAMTGSYGRGADGLTSALQAAALVPGSWQEVVAAQAAGAFGQRQARYETVLQTLPASRFAEPASRTATSYRLSTDTVRGAMAGGEALYEQAQTHLGNLAALGRQVDATSNVKDAQDLHNRIATENGLLQSALAKLGAMQLQLEANAANQFNQSTAARQQYFGRSGPSGPSVR